MRLKGHRPAYQKALDFITRNLDSGTWKDGAQLPSIRVLAQSAEVSFVTMFKAVKAQVESGALSMTGHGRLVAGRIINDEKAVAMINTPLDRNRVLIEKDIISGAFGIQGKLPSAKELQSRYGICYRTLKKILLALEHDGVIDARGTGYALPNISAKPSQQKIVFITMTGHYSQNSAINHEQNRIVNLFENECLQINIGMQIVEVDFYDALAVRREMGRLIGDDSILGYILDIWWYGEQTFQRSYTDMLVHLASHKKPVTIIDELGVFVLPHSLDAQPLVQVYTFERKRAGERMGRFLLGSGHQSLLYLTILPNARWSIERYEGINSIFVKVGPGAVKQIGAEPAEVVMPGLLSRAGLTESQVKRMIAAGRTPSQAKDLENQWKEFLRQGQDIILNKAYANPGLLKNINMFSSVLNQKFDNDFLDTLSIATIRRAGERTFNITLEPLFQRAIACADATAWVCANDTIALAALSFLKSKDRRVPDQISIVGFDNIPVSSLEQRLTTFDFNAMGFVHRMINFILRPPRPRGIYRHQVIEVEGIIMKRETAGKANIK